MHFVLCQHSRTIRLSPSMCKRMYPGTITFTHSVIRDLTQSSCCVVASPNPPNPPPDFLYACLDGLESRLRAVCCVMRSDNFLKLEFPTGAPYRLTSSSPPKKVEQLQHPRILSGYIIGALQKVILLGHYQAMEISRRAVILCSLCLVLAMNYCCAQEIGGNILSTWCKIVRCMHNYII